MVNGTIVEEGMAGIQVTLLDTNNDPVATTISAGDGSYWFTNLPPGDYAVRIGPVPPDFVFAGAPIDCLQGMPYGFTSYHHVLRILCIINSYYSPLTQLCYQ